MLEKIKSFGNWAIGIALLVLYFLFDSKRKKVAELEAQLKTDALTKDVEHATEKMEDARADYESARAEYDKLRSDV